MKLINKTILLLALGLGSLPFYSQSNIPQNATDYMAKNHNPSSIDWIQTDTGFDATFQTSSGESKVVFDDKGNFKQDYIPVDFSLLNPNVQTYLDDNFKSKHIQNCYLTHSNSAPERNIVKVKVKSVEKTIYFRPNGDFHYEEEK